MQPLTREQREHQLTAMMLENRRTLYATYAIVIGVHPPAWLTDREIILAILRKEFAASPAPKKTTRAPVTSS